MTSDRRPSGTARTLLLTAAAIVLVEAAIFAVLAVLELADVSSGRVGLGVGATAAGAVNQCPLDGIRVGLG